MSKAIVRQLILDVEDSNVVREIYYDNHNKDLVVTFETGDRGVYKDVPSEVVGGFLVADSVGSYLHHAIKKEGKYKYERIK